MELIRNFFQIIGKKVQSFVSNFLTRECSNNFSIMMEILGLCQI